MSWTRDDPRVSVKRVDELKRGLSEVFGDPALGDLKSIMERSSPRVPFY